MKKLFFLLFFLSSLIYSQNDDICKFDSSVEFDESIFSHSIYRNINEEEPLVLNVKFVIVRDDDGNNIYGIEEQHALLAIAKLNMIFNNYNIFFKYRGLTYYDKSIFLNCSLNGGPTVINLLNAYINEGYYDYNNIHVFVTIGGPSASNGSSDVFMNKYAMIDILNNFANNSDRILIHEFGHALKLHHIFRGTINQDPSYTYNGMPITCGINPINQKNRLTLPVFDSGILPENVTRDPNNSNYNATTAGDHVVDTNATFYHHKDNSCEEYDQNTQQLHVNFVEHPDVVDQTGEMYVDITDDEFYNFMAYGTSDRFTPGQIVRMREAIVTDSWLSPKRTTVNSLYEPYKTICENNDDPIWDDVYLRSGLNFKIKRPNVPNINCKHYYQPGFDYEVSYCNPYTSPPMVGGLLYSFDTSIIPSYTSYGTSINIAQLSSFNEANCVPYPMGVNYNVIGGKVIEIQLNTYNIDDKTEPEINDPNLIQDIPNGLNTIIIHTESGQSAQKTILK